MRTLFLLLALAGHGLALDNLLGNGSFEGGSLADWTANGATVSTDQAHDGAWSARITTQSMRTTVATVAGRAYKVTGWVRITQESGSDWGGFRFAVADQSWTTLAHSDWLLRSTHGGEWFKVAIGFVATGSSVTLDVGHFGGSGRTMTAWLDDVVAFAKPADNRPPEVTATLTPTAIGALPATQAFAVVGDDPDGAIRRVAWDFGDGGRAQGASGSRRVGVPGAWTATVRITDDEGALVVRTIPWSSSGGGFPTIAVTAPAPVETTVSTPTLALSGTAGGAGVAVTLSSDRDWFAQASGATSWSAQVALRPGLNRILAQATAGGRVATVERRVRYVPSTALAVAGVSAGSNVERWEPLEITCRVDGSAATHPQFPYDPAPPPGLGWVDGISVDGLFTRDGWATTHRRPAFLLQRHRRERKGGEEWLHPEGDPVWCVRFAPPATGTWTWRIEAREARGTASSAERTFTATPPTDPLNRGPVRVAPDDARYFAFADGTHFPGSGHGIGASGEAWSYDIEDAFDHIGAGNQHFFRWWIAGSVWGSAWQPWNSRTLPYEGNVPATGLALDAAYGDGLAAWRLDAANPILFQGWMSGHAPLVPGRAYRLRVRWRCAGVTGPAVAGQLYGVCVKFTGWPEPGHTGSIPTLVPHVAGDAPWHVASATFTATGDLIPNVSLILENATGGAAWIDECAVHEVLADGTHGPQLLRSPRANSHLAFDPRRGAGLEAATALAAARGMHLKLVIGEKQDWLLNRLAPDGLPDPLGGHFNRGPGSPTHRLHHWYWRHLLARLGAWRSVHSWELVNEEDPGSRDHFRLAADLARFAAADGNPHLASTSTWASLAEDRWKDQASAPISFNDFHCYVRGTGWIEPKDALADDSARFFLEYDRAARAAFSGAHLKPVVWGEQGIDGTDGTDGQEPGLARDTQGVWLHKMVWARCAPGGVHPLSWYTDHIFGHDLHGIYGAWHRFMDGIPLANGRYADAEATATAADLRVVGQKDVTAGCAHLWIDNRRHTWRAVVDGTAIPSVSGTVRIVMNAAGARYVAAWWDTGRGIELRRETVVAGGDGAVALAVAALATDTAVRLERQDTGDQPPSVVTSAAATLDVGRARAALTVLGGDDGGEAALAYTWSTVGASPATVAFAPNGTNAAKVATASFTRAGGYTLRCTIRDAAGQSAVSEAVVTVPQVATAVRIIP